MSSRDIPVAPLALGYAGVLPFALLAAALALDAPGSARLAAAFLLYSALILSFLGGIRWGAAAAGFAGWQAYVWAVLPSLWAFGCLMLADERGALWGLLGGFVALGAVDVVRPPPGQPRWMASLRLRLTLAVAACHGLALVAI